MAMHRRFDHDECAALYATGDWNYQQLADKYGVTDSAIYQMLARRDPDKRQAMNAYSREYQRRHNRTPCKGNCGRFIWMINNRTGYCQPCFQAQQYGDGVLPDSLLCRRCNEWKPDEEFYPSKKMPLRRYRKSHCCVCDNAQRREWRRRNPERQRAYDRERKRRLKQAAA